MSLQSFAEVANRVKNNKIARVEAERQRNLEAREERLDIIAKLMDAADKRGESSISIDVDMVKDEQDIAFMNAHVRVTEKRSADGRLVAYKINW